MRKTISKKLLSKVASKKTLKKNEKAIKSYDAYKETADLIERVDVALGRKAAFKAATGSTLNFEVDQHGVASTTAQKI
jgi:hypothetical protein